ADLRFAHTSRHIPVDRANFVPEIVWAELVKIHSASFEDAVVLAGESRFHETTGAKFQFTDFFQNLRDRLHGFKLVSGSQNTCYFEDRILRDGKPDENSVDEGFARHLLGLCLGT